MRPRRLAIAVLVGGVALAAVLAAAGPLLLPVRQGVSREGLINDPAPDQAALQERIRAILSRAGIAGAGIALVGSDGGVWTGGIGEADLATGRPVTSNTTFRLGSISKNVTALAVMEQVEGGRLSLSDRLREVAPEVAFGNHWEASHPVTIANLLEHTAGFEFARFNEDVDPGPEPRSLAGALALNQRSRESRWPPGSRMSYSNEGYLAAGYLLEKVTGENFDDVVSKGVFAPLGMSTAAFLKSPAADAALATGYGPDGREQRYLDDAMRPAANLIASPEDMARYLQFWLGQGSLDGRRLLTAASVERMQVRLTLASAGPEEQYGLGTDTQQYGGFVGHGHTGWTYGFSASFRYFPREKVGWALMLNSSDPKQVRTAIEDEIAAFLLRGQTPELVPAARAADAGAADAGYYQDAAPADRLTAPLTRLFSGRRYTWSNGQLLEQTWSPGGIRALLTPARGRPVLPAADGGFRHTGESRSSLRFVEDAVVTESGYFEKVPLWQVLVAHALFFAGLGLLASILVAVAGWTAEAAVLARLPTAAWARALPAAAALAGLGAASLLYAQAQPLWTVNATSVGVFVLSIAFGVFSVLSLLVWLVIPWEAAGPSVKLYCASVSAAAVGLLVFAWMAQWIGLRTWLW